MNRWLFGPSLGLAVVAVAASACGTAGTSTAGQPAAPRLKGMDFTLDLSDWRTCGER